MTDTGAALLITHYWWRCDHPLQCGAESYCYLSRGAAAGAAGAHKAKHATANARLRAMGIVDGVRPAVSIRIHSAQADPRAICLHSADDADRKVSMLEGLR